MAEPVTVITGAANGIGRQLALDLLARRGRRLVLCDLDAAGLERSFGGAAATLYCIDVARIEEWRTLSTAPASTPCAASRWPSPPSCAGVASP